MTLTPGSTLASYEILDRLGAGAMGEVYRARDGRLQREVAIKVLPDHLATSPERLARFERNDRQLLVVDFEDRATLAPGRPSLLFEGEFAVGRAIGPPGFDVSAEGERFVMVRERSETGGAEIRVVLNRLDEVIEGR